MRSILEEAEQKDKDEPKKQRPPSPKVPEDDGDFAASSRGEIAAYVADLQARRRGDLRDATRRKPLQRRRRER